MQSKTNALYMGQDSDIFLLRNILKVAQLFGEWWEVAVFMYTLQNDMGYSLTAGTAIFG